MNATIAQQMTSDGTARYNSMARALHWVIALLVIGNLAGGLLHDALEDVINLMPLHKASGMTVLALSLVRIAWRLTWTAPRPPSSMSGLEIAGAKAVHALFYGLMLAMPLTGWIMSSAGKYPLTWFGLFDIPKLPVTRETPLYDLGHEGHEILGWVFIVLALLHIAAALRHHLLLKDNVLRRMM